MGEERSLAQGTRAVARISAICAVGAVCLGLSGCGGRVSNPVPERTALDSELSCRHVIAEKRKLKKRIADLQDERNENRRRSLARVPSAVISGNPFSALFFADPSVAIYKEINAAKRRNRVLDQLLRQKGCIAPAKPTPVAAPSATPPATPAAAPTQPTPPVAAESVNVAPVAPAPTTPDAPLEPAPTAPTE